MALLVLKGVFVEASCFRELPQGVLTLICRPLTPGIVSAQHLIACSSAVCFPPVLSSVSVNSFFV